MPYILVLALLSFSVTAKLTVIGKLPESYLLIQKLQTLNKEQKLWEIHKTWLDQIANYIQDKEELSNNHPARYFNQQEAKIILKPILLNAYQLDLSDKKIKSKFGKQANNPTSEEYTDSNFFRTDNTKQQVFEVAKQIYNIANNHWLIAIGQTPVYCTAMVKEINAYNQGSTKILEIAFSGRADLPTIDRHQSTWDYAYKNILTRDKELFYRTYLSKNGFDPKRLSNNKVYLLDYTSGPSLASWLLLITRWFVELDLSLPDFVLLNLAAVDDIQVIENGKWHKPSLKQPLNLSINKNLEFSIDTIYLGLDKEIFLAFADINDNLRVLPVFNALYWRQEHMSLFSLYPGKQAKKLLRRYSNFARLKLKE